MVQTQRDLGGGILEVEIGVYSWGAGNEGRGEVTGRQLYMGTETWTLLVLRRARECRVRMGYSQ